MGVFRGSACGFILLLILLPIVPLSAAASPTRGEEKQQGATLDPAFEPPPLLGSALSYAAATANLEHRHMLASDGGYRSGANRTWSIVIDSSRSFLGNTFIIRGFIQLYDATGNATYLSWAKGAANSLWAKGWDKRNKGFYDSYDDNWKNLSCNQPLQENAEFVHITLDLYSRTSNATYLSWAGQTMNFIMARFHDNTYGGVFYIWSPCSRSVVDSNKYLETSLGAFTWAAMKWYGFTHNSTALRWSTESVNWMRRYLWNSTYGGYASASDRVGHPINRYYYPNIEMWGMTGMLELYGQTGNSTVKAWARDGLNHIKARMWDSQYGGWYRKLNGDNSVKEDSKTGWDNCEQPWLWYNSYKKTGVPTDASVSAFSAAWTISHIWDKKYGGIFLEADRKAVTLLDDSKFDWVQGGCMVAFALQPRSPRPVPSAIDTSSRMGISAYAPASGTYLIGVALSAERVLPVSGRTLAVVSALAAFRPISTQTLRRDP